MNRKRIALAALALLATTAIARAEEKKAPAGMPDMNDPAMQAMMKAGTPGPQHQHLAQLAGDWTFTTTFWMAPGAPPQSSTGTMHAETMMGGRYLSQVWKADMMGMPFEGHATEGYDNVAKHWFGTWMDNMSTGMMTSTGSCNEAMDSCTYNGEAWDPMSGQKTTSRSVITWTGADSFKNEAWGPGPDGKEMKMMEIVAKRKS